MSDTAFRNIATPPTPSAPESTTTVDADPSTQSQKITEYDTSEPVEASQSQEAVLEALGIDDMVMNLPDEDQSKLNEVSQYIRDILETKGVPPTKNAFRETLDTLREDMGLDLNADPQIVLDRIGGVVKAWKELSFVSDPREKRSLFMKLARQPDSKSMNKMIFEEMTRKSVWR